MNYFIGASAAGLAEMLPRWREPDVRVVIITGAIPDKYITHYSVEELVDLAEDREDLIRALLRPDLRLARPAAVALLSRQADHRGDDRRHRWGRARALAQLRHPDHAARRLSASAFPRRRLGILTGTGSQLLERAIGRSRALDFLLRSRYVTPEGALELGIVNELADDARARALEVAERPRAASPVALDAAKRSVVRGANLPMQEGLRVEARGVAEDDRHRRGDGGHARLRRDALRPAARVGARPRCVAGAGQRDGQLTSALRPRRRAQATRAR